MLSLIWIPVNTGWWTVDRNKGVIKLLLMETCKQRPPTGTCEEIAVPNVWVVAA